MASGFSAIDGVETPSEISNDEPDQSLSQQISAWNYRRVALALVAVSAALGCLSIVGSRGPQSAEHTLVSPTQGVNLQQLSSCPAAPILDGNNLEEIIKSNTGILIVANPEMRCTQAVKAALQAKGTQYVEKHFETPFQYTEGASPIWDWLHCSYPDDKQGPTIMHSYVFDKAEFIGQGFAAATKIEGSSVGGGVAAQSCDERYPDDATVVKNYMDSAANKVLLFGWLSCPCTGIAQGRFATQSICYEGRNWANPDSSLMTYLQCKESTTEDHSFVYFRDASGDWKFAGNGFQLDEDDMSDEQFNSLVQESGVEKTCHHASVKVNVYGAPLEECRVGADMMGSWQDDGTCSEQVGGIHEICIESLPSDFSSETHQPPWSKDRAGKRHCVCVGAWSLYMTDDAKHPDEASKIMPHCNAIPETALTDRYLQNWKDWNGYPADVVKGVGELVSRCLDSVDEAEPHAARLKCGLKKRFNGLQDKVADLQTSSDLQALKDKLAALQCPSAA